MLMRRHGPRKVPGDIIRHKKSITDEGTRRTTPSLLTVSSEVTGISDRSSGSDRTLRQEAFPPLDTKPKMLSGHHEQQQRRPGEPRKGEKHAAPTPEGFERLEYPDGSYQYVLLTQWPPTPESIDGAPPTNADGSASLPPPQSMHSGHHSPDALDPFSNRPAMPPAENSAWNGQQGDRWGQGTGPSLHTPIRSGVSLFHQPGYQIAHAGINTRQGSLPQTPRPNVRLEDQVEALREHVASQQRPIGPDFRCPIGAPGPYWQQHQQMYPMSPQLQRTGIDNGQQGLRSMRPPPNGMPSPAPTTSSFPDLKKTTLEGYELLAAKLTDGTTGVRPMYRSFEHLHHRLLLYIQDEICEYEEELRNLDEWISQVGNAVSEGKSKPASRRAEARITPADSELMFRRKFVLGEIFVKLERYHRALEAYSNASKDLQRPQAAEVTRYREWMAAHRPVDMTEAAFLTHDKDLLVLPRRTTEVSNVTATIASLPLLLLLPFVAFAVMPNFLCRILAISACSMGQWALCSIMDIRHVLTAREWLISAGIYVAFMTLIAAVAR
ncbi:hypothetical protein E4T39_00515 [Aureobasidium subglaciale]|nr:hypothetical protein E4T39_00515 [Aureobasidium subglaciale]